MLAPVPAKRADGGSSFASLGKYVMHEVNAQTGEISLRGDVVISEALLDASTAAAEMKAVAEQNNRVKDPVMHLILSWDKADHPTRDQWKDSVDYVMQSLGMREHQYLAVGHDDTENFHVHIMANRVHPETYAPNSQEWVHKTLDRAIRELENKHGWKEGKGLYRWDEERGIAVPTTREERNLLKNGASELGTGKAAKAEIYSGIESLEAYCKAGPAKELNAVMKQDSVSWLDVHRVMQKHGIQLHKVETGGFKVSAEGDSGERIYVKASNVFRSQFAGKAQRAKTDEKLGPWSEQTASNQVAVSKESKSVGLAESKRVAKKPGIAPVGVNPPPHARNRLRQLSSLKTLEMERVDAIADRQETAANKYDPKKATRRESGNRIEREFRTAERKAEYQSYRNAFYDARKFEESRAQEQDKAKLREITRVGTELRKEIRGIGSPEIRKAMLAAVTDANERERKQIRNEAKARRKAAKPQTFRSWSRAYSRDHGANATPDAASDARRAVKEAQAATVAGRRVQQELNERQAIDVPAFDPVKIQAEWRAETEKQFSKVQQKAQRVKGKTASALERQLGRLHAHDAMRPDRHSGLFAGFRSGQYEATADTWKGIADSLARRWAELRGRDQRVGAYLERSSVPGFLSKGEELSERWAAVARPSLAETVEAIRQHAEDDRRRAQEARRGNRQELTKEQIAEAVKAKLKAELKKGNKL